MRHTIPTLLLLLLMAGRVDAQTPDPGSAQPDTAALADSIAAAFEGTWAEEAADSAREARLLGLELPPPLVFGGQATMTSDLYASGGIDARRPGAVWQMSLTPQVNVFSAVSVNVDVLLSTDQSHFRQNISHLGLNPTWSWGGAHIGDFNRDYSPFVLQGSRVRGLGLDVEPGSFRFSVQGGRMQRMTTGAIDGPVYRRNMLAASMGVGRETGTHLNLSMITAKDDLGEEADRVIQDSIPLDTIPPELRPRMDSRPQENVAVGMDGQLVLFGRAVRLSGGAAVSLYNRDLLADTVPAEEADLAVLSGLGEWVAERRPFTTATSLDFAYEVEGNLDLGALRLRGGYEEVGPGYGSLGLPYLINDRRAYHANAMTQFWNGRLAVQGQYRNQSNNLVDQKLHTVDRVTANGSVTARLTDAVATTFTGLVSDLTNDAAADSARLDLRSVAATANVAVQSELLGRASVLSLGYSLQRTDDGNVNAAVPTITAHNVTGGVQVTLSPRFSVAPSVSAVLTDGEGVEESRDVLFGFRGTGAFLDGDLRTMGNLTHSSSRGRQVSSGRLQASYPVGWGADLTFQARHNRYSALGDRPAFNETFVTTAISRSF
ncbi:MAG TPA: hypothetical protein VK966_07460 [Longimicrobiales bacterium]|nr:hypothetical protein [Longimicrobiales bacterium]